MPAYVNTASSHSSVPPSLQNRTGTFLDFFTAAHPNAQRMRSDNSEAVSQPTHNPKQQALSNNLNNRLRQLAAAIHDNSKCLNLNLPSSNSLNAVLRHIPGFRLTVFRVRRASISSSNIGLVSSNERQAIQKLKRALWSSTFTEAENFFKANGFIESEDTDQSDDGNSQLMALESEDTDQSANDNSQSMALLGNSINFIKNLKKTSNTKEQSNVKNIIEQIETLKTALVGTDGSANTNRPLARFFDKSLASLEELNNKICAYQQLRPCSTDAKTNTKTQNPVPDILPKYQKQLKKEIDKFCHKLAKLDGRFRLAYVLLNLKKRFDYYNKQQGNLTNENVYELKLNHLKERVRTNKNSHWLLRVLFACTIGSRFVMALVNREMENLENKVSKSKNPSNYTNTSIKYSRLNFEQKNDLQNKFIKSNQTEIPSSSSIEKPFQCILQLNHRSDLEYYPKSFEDAYKQFLTCQTEYINAFKTNQSNHNDLEIKFKEATKIALSAKDSKKLRTVLLNFSELANKNKETSTIDTNKKTTGFVKIIQWLGGRGYGQRMQSKLERFADAAVSLAKAYAKEEAVRTTILGNLGGYDTNLVSLLKNYLETESAEIPTELFTFLQSKNGSAFALKLNKALLNGGLLNNEDCSKLNNYIKSNCINNYLENLKDLNKKLKRGTFECFLKYTFKQNIALFFKSGAYNLWSSLALNPFKICTKLNNREHKLAHMLASLEVGLSVGADNSAEQGRVEPSGLEATINTKFTEIKKQHNQIIGDFQKHSNAFNYLATKIGASLFAVFAIGSNPFCWIMAFVVDKIWGSAPPVIGDILFGTLGFVLGFPLAAITLPFYLIARKNRIEEYNNIQENPAFLSDNIATFKAPVLESDAQEPLIKPYAVDLLKRIKREYLRSCEDVTKDMDMMFSGVNKIFKTWANNLDSENSLKPITKPLAAWANYANKINRSVMNSLYSGAAFKPLNQKTPILSHLEKVFVDIKRSALLLFQGTVSGFIVLGALVALPITYMAHVFVTHGVVKTLGYMANKDVGQFINGSEKLNKMLLALLLASTRTFGSSSSAILLLIAENSMQFLGTGVDFLCNWHVNTREAKIDANKISNRVINNFKSLAVFKPLKQEKPVLSALGNLCTDAWSATKLTAQFAASIPLAFGAVFTSLLSTGIYRTLSYIYSLTIAKELHRPEDNKASKSSEIIDQKIVSMKRFYDFNQMLKDLMLAPFHIIAAILLLLTENITRLISSGAFKVKDGAELLSAGLARLSNATATN